MHKKRDELYIRQTICISGTGETKKNYFNIRWSQHRRASNCICQIHLHLYLCPSRRLHCHIYISPTVFGFHLRGCWRYRMPPVCPQYLQCYYYSPSSQYGNQMLTYRGKPSVIARLGFIMKQYVVLSIL